MKPRTQGRDVHSFKELQAAADAYAATPEAHADGTYLGHIRQVADALREQGAIGPSDKVPDSVTRRRAAKWLSRAWGSIPRPQMEAKYGCGWLSQLVTRLRELEGELHARLRGVKLDADPLPEEVRLLSARKGRFAGAAAPELLFIAGDWNREPTAAGDCCIEALMEVLDNERRGSKDPGQPARGEDPAGMLGHQEGDAGALAARAGAARGAVGRHAQGVLARRRGEVPR